MMISYPDQSPHDTPTAPMLRVPGSSVPDEREERPTIPYLFPIVAEEPLAGAETDSWWPAG